MSFIVDPSNTITTKLYDNIRTDGRSLSDYRNIIVTRGICATNRVGETNLSVGSSRVSIGDTAILCTANLLIGTPTLQSPDRGEFVVNVQLDGFCSPKYDQKLKNEEADKIASIITNLLQSQKLLDPKQLVIVKGKFAYRIQFNLTCLSYDGNLEDACILALIAVIQDVTLPNDCKPSTDGKKVLISPERSVKLIHHFRNCFPITVGLLLHPVSQGIVAVIDPTEREEMVCSSKFTCLVHVASEHAVGTPQLLLCHQQPLNSSHDQTKRSGAEGLDAEQMINTILLCQQTAMKVHSGDVYGSDV